MVSLLNTLFSFDKFFRFIFSSKIKNWRIGHDVNMKFVKEILDIFNEKASTRAEKLHFSLSNIYLFVFRSKDEFRGFYEISLFS